MKPLFFAPWEELCIALFRKFNAKSDKYNDQELNSLPTDIISWAKAASQISWHSTHQVTLDFNVESKIFWRQIARLQKIDKSSDYLWWKNFLLSQDLRVKFNTDIYAHCFPLAMFFLDTSCFNAFQRHAIDSATHLPNNIGLITESAATRKIALLVAMVMLCLWALSTKGVSDN